MIKLYSSNGELKQIAENNDLMFHYHNFSTLEELDNILKENVGKTIYGSNLKDITIEGIVIRSWSKWFIPYSSTVGDMIGFAIYPSIDLGLNYIIGITNGNWKKTI